MKKALQKLTAMLLALAVAAALFSFSAFAATDAANSDAAGAAISALADIADAVELTDTEQLATAEEEGESAVRALSRVYLSTRSIASRYVSAYRKMTLLHNGKTLTSDARAINGITYVALRAVINELTDMKVSYSSKTRTLTAEGMGLTLTATDGSNIVYANGRVLYSEHPNVIMNNGRMYIPVLTLAKALRLSAVGDGGSRVTLSGTPRAILSADSYYRADELYWLSRIISAESRGEPLLGQIAVGNVVLNRVKSNLYPNTIWGVIFDRRYGVQFSPVANGSIYNTPAEISVTAAKICLEGYSLSSEVMFFIQPKAANSAWMQSTRKYLFTVQNHDFYA